MSVRACLNTENRSKMSFQKFFWVVFVCLLFCLLLLFSLQMGVYDKAILNRSTVTLVLISSRFPPFLLVFIEPLCSNCSFFTLVVMLGKTLTAIIYCNPFSASICHLFYFCSILQQQLQRNDRTERLLARRPVFQAFGVVCNSVICQHFHIFVRFITRDCFYFLVFAITFCYYFYIVHFQSCFLFCLQYIRLSSTATQFFVFLSFLKMHPISRVKQIVIKDIACPVCLQYILSL